MTTASGHAQTPAPRPNFAGTWVWDAVATDAVSSPIRTGANIFGASFVAHQDEKTLTLDITIAPNVPTVKAAYALDGSVTKNVSPAQTPGAEPIVVTAVAKWIGDMLAVESRSQSVVADRDGKPMTVDVVSTRTMRLDAQGRLVIDRDGTPPQIVPSTRSVYVRKP